MKFTAVDTGLYYAKAVQPPCSTWRLPMVPWETLMPSVRLFLEDWELEGQHAQVDIFYRDGTRVWSMTNQVTDPRLLCSAEHGDVEGD